MPNLLPVDFAILRVASDYLGCLWHPYGFPNRETVADIAQRTKFHPDDVWYAMKGLKMRGLLKADPPL